MGRENLPKSGLRGTDGPAAVVLLLAKADGLFLDDVF